MLTMQESKMNIRTAISHVPPVRQVEVFGKLLLLYAFTIRYVPVLCLKR